MHCFRNKTGHPVKVDDQVFVAGLHKLTFPIGSPNKWRKEIVHEIDEVFSPKGYKQRTMKHDIAIAFVKKPFKFNKKVKPIKLAKRDENLAGEYYRLDTPLGPGDSFGEQLLRKQAKKLPKGYKTGA